MSEQLQLPREWWEWDSLPIVDPTDGAWAPEPPVLSAAPWPTNAAIMRACKRLGFLSDEWSIIDPTYGQGTWWTEWMPANLTAHSRQLEGEGARLRPPFHTANPSWDFRDTGYADDQFDAATFDPPYCAMGSRDKTTGSVQGMAEHYGMVDAPRTPGEVQQLINDGLTEMARIVVPSKRQSDGPGIIMVKVMNYGGGGSRNWPGTYRTFNHAETLGLRYVCQFDMVHGSGGPQPKGKRQIHPRNNMSTLLVLRTPKRKAS